MKTGIELIAEERRQQIEQHGRTVKADVDFNTGEQLRKAAHRLIEVCPSELNPPKGWDGNIWAKMCRKPYLERMVIAGSLLAAEIDRVKYAKRYRSAKP